MNVLLVLIISAVFFYFAIRWYGRLTAKWMGENPNRTTPAVELSDGKDYVPTKQSIIFAHHFTTIAGAGPIVGPTVAILFGYGPVWLWVLIGAIMIGAVHDFTSLFISLRERGKSIAEITRNTLGTTGFFLFLCFAVMLLMLVAAAFMSMTVQALTSTVPLDFLGLQSGQTVLNTVVKDGVTHGIIGGIASTSVIIITLLAPILGYLIYKRGLNLGLAYVLAAVIAFGSVLIGLVSPITLDPKNWMLVLSVYVIFASALPVWMLLQPRDFTNVQILYLGILAMIVTIIIGGFQGMTMQAPVMAIDAGQVKLGAIWPFLFITVACGAVSGFHSLVSTGTTAKQVSKEGHARNVGYNGMILEGLLAVGTLIIVGAALSQPQYLQIVWPAPGAGTSNPILAFSLSMATMLNTTLGIPVYIGCIFGILLMEGFVVTTLDSAIRLNRYLLEELWNVLFKGNAPAFMRHPWFNSALGVLMMLWLAWNNAFTAIWPLFGSCNQLLAALTLLAVSSWLLKRRRQAWFTIIPACFMVITTIAALFTLLLRFITQLRSGAALSGPLTLVIMDMLCLALAIGVVFMACRNFQRVREGKGIVAESSPKAA